jgi:hypothetical protein
MADDGARIKSNSAHKGVSIKLGLRNLLPDCGCDDSTLRGIGGVFRYRNGEL